MNNYINYKIPTFYQKEGEDWEKYSDITEDNVDNIINKTVQLYWLKDIDKMSNSAIEKSLRLRKLTYAATDTLFIKKKRLRNFVTHYKKKGLLEYYLDIAEFYSGIRGSITFRTVGAIIGEGETGRATMPFLMGGTSLDSYIVYINPKTTDSDILDLIQYRYQEKEMKPAFYQIYLVDDDGKTLRTI